MNPETELADYKFWCNAHAQRVSQLQAELAAQSAAVEAVWRWKTIAGWGTWEDDVLPLIEKARGGK